MLSALSQFFLQWQHFFQEMGVAGLLAFGFALFVIQLFCLPLTPFGIMAGLFFGLRNGLIAVQFGTVLGATVNFLISRYFLRERFSRWLAGHEKFRLIDEAIGREGWKIVALLRFCPIPFGLANYSYGLTAVRFVPYLVATFFAILVPNVFFVWFGATSHEALAVITGQAKVTGGQTVFTIIGLVAFFCVLTYVGRLARATVARR